MKIFFVRTIALAGALLGIPGKSLGQESRLSNLALRGTAGDGGVLISGFNLGPGSDTTVLVRAIGPTLGQFGVPNPLLDPKLELYNGAGEKIAENDDARASDAAIATLAGAFPLNPGTKDAALVATLSPGNYTARVGGNGAGVALIEVYAVPGGGARLTNLSARAQIGTGGNILIPGFTIAPGAGTRRLLIRGVGPTLAEFGAVGTAADPKLELYAGEVKLSENDNWNTRVGLIPENTSALADAFAQAGAFPLNPNSKDAAMIVTLPSGNYTLQVRGADGGVGEALVEIYEIAPVETITVQSFTIIKERIGNRYYYRPQLGLAETSGKSAVTVTQLQFYLEDFGPAGRFPPWLVAKVIQAGQVREIIDYVGGIGGYPEFEMDSSDNGRIVSLSISYVDSQKRIGSISTFALLPP